MAETLISPGVFLQENDLSQITSGPVTAGAAIVGPTSAAPAATGPCVIWDKSFSFKKTPGLISVSAIYIIFI